MREDQIIEEVRLHQEQHAARFNYDLSAIYQNIKEQKNESKRHFTSYPENRLKTNIKIRIIYQD